MNRISCYPVRFLMSASVCSWPRKLIVKITFGFCNNGCWVALDLTETLVLVCPLPLQFRNWYVLCLCSPDLIARPPDHLQSTTTPLLSSRTSSTHKHEQTPHPHPSISANMKSFNFISILVALLIIDLASLCQGEGVERRWGGFADSCRNIRLSEYNLEADCWTGNDQLHFTRLDLNGCVGRSSFTSERCLFPHPLFPFGSCDLRLVAAFYHTVK